MEAKNKLQLSGVYEMEAVAVICKEYDARTEEVNRESMIGYQDNGSENWKVKSKRKELIC